ncbi:MAG: endonuclease III [Acidobacteriota bacterium]
MASPPAAARQAARASLAVRRRRALRIIQALHETYPEADCALRHGSAWQLLVATILSAQCTDTRVNKVTPVLFRQYRSIRSFARAGRSALEETIRSTGFFRSKARSIQEAARHIIEKHGGRVPSSMEDLTRLPGVGRKTAHVVRGTWFHLPAITVDTHVGRLSRRLGLTLNLDPVKVERDLEKVLPEADRTFTSHALIWHGRQVCQARKADCGACHLSRLCPSAGRL